jgi:hypothetical protein
MRVANSANRRNNMSSDGTIKTKKDLMDLLEREAKLYRKEGIEASLRRNEHMHKFRGKFHAKLADAILVDFINSVASGQGLDLGLYTHDITDDDADVPESGTSAKRGKRE